MLFRLLGPVEVSDGDRPVRLGEGKQRAVLALLLLHRNEVVSSDRLIDALWGEAPPATAAKVLQNHVGQLRRALDDRDGAATSDAGPRLRAKVQDGELDVDRFDAARGGGCRGARARATRRRRPPGCARRSRCGAGRRWPTLRTRRSRSQRSRGSRSGASRRWSSASTPTWRSAATPTSWPSSRGWSPSTRCASACARSSWSPCTAAAARRTPSRPTARRGACCSTSSVVEPGPALRELQAAILRQDPELAPAPGAWPRPLRSSRRRIALLAVGGALLAGAAVAAALLASSDPEKVRVRLGANAVAAIDLADGAVTDAVDVGPSPSHLAADGRTLWVTNADGHSVSRVDLDDRSVRADGPGRQRPRRCGRRRRRGVGGQQPRRHRVAHRRDARTPSCSPSPSGTNPTGVAAGAGAVWVANSGEQTISRIDPQSGRATTIDVHAAPTELAVGAGAVWMTSSSTRTVSRLDPRSRRVVEVIDVGGGAERHRGRPRRRLGRQHASTAPSRGSTRRPPS